jgi:hypothetical protein
MPKDLGVGKLLNTEHTFNVWVAYFKALKATKLASAKAIESPDSWEAVEPPTLSSFARAGDTFKTPKKLKLSPMHVP